MAIQQLPIPKNMISEELSEAYQKTKFFTKNRAKYKYRDEFQYNFDEPLGGRTMGNKNHCVLTGGMSICDTTSLRKKEEKIKCQEECEFFIKASFDSRCMFEVYGEYCWSTKAQDKAKGK